MGHYVSLRAQQLAGKQFSGGDTIPDELIAKDRVGQAIYAGVLCYVPDPGEPYKGPWPGDQHTHFSVEMDAVIAQAQANVVAAPPAAGKKEGASREATPTSVAPPEPEAPSASSTEAEFSYDDEDKTPTKRARPAVKRTTKKPPTKR